MDDANEMRQVPEPPPGSPFQPYQVVLTFPSLARMFERWVRENGWELSPRLIMSEDDLPVRYIQPSSWSNQTPGIPEVDSPPQIINRDGTVDDVECCASGSCEVCRR